MPMSKVSNRIPCPDYDSDDKWRFRAKQFGVKHYHYSIFQWGPESWYLFVTILE
jgi:hypothetical protein